MESSSPVYYLDKEEVEEICFYLAERLFKFEEPLPEFKTRFPSKLESILEIPKHGFGNKELYPTLLQKAACYFYFIIKNHPFLNGNKRLAILTTFVFLKLNNHTLKVPWKKMYDFAIGLANGTEDHKKEFKKNSKIYYPTYFKRLKHFTS